MHLAFTMLATVAIVAGSDVKDVPRRSLLRAVDLNVGDSQEVELADGTKARVKLIEVKEVRDGLRSAIREAQVKIEVNGKAITLVSANYRLPVTVAGVQVDCPITQGYYRNCDAFEDSWGLEKDARLRLWPAGSPFLESGTFVYPVKQRPRQGLQSRLLHGLAISPSLAVFNSKAYDSIVLIRDNSNHLNCRVGAGDAGGHGVRGRQ